MNDVRFSIIIHAKNTDVELFKNAMRNLQKVSYLNFQIILFDSNTNPFVKNVFDEVFSKDKRAIYRKLNKKFYDAQVYNLGLRLIDGDFCCFLGQYDFFSYNILKKVENVCISSLIPEKEDMDFDDLRMAASKNKLRLWKESCPNLIYMDYDEIIDNIRQNPHFLGAFSPELLVQKDYFKNAFFISIGLLKEVGLFNEKLITGEIYEYELRILERYLKVGGKNKIKPYHISGLLFHKTIENVDDDEKREYENKKYQIKKTIAKAYFDKNKIEIIIEDDKDKQYWKLKRIAKKDVLMQSDYILLKNKNIVVKNEKKSLSSMYSYLEERDVAAVGGKFVSGNLILNCGFIFDKDGVIYPACATQDAREKGYDDRMILSREVSMVDPSFCMIKKSIFNKLGGFDIGLTKRDSMLSFCLKAINRGYRIIFDPDVIVKSTEIMNESNEESNKKLNEIFSSGDYRGKISEGDIYYNENLYMGVQNYYF